MSESPARMKVMALAPSMRTGGAERVLALLLEHLDRARFDLELVTVLEGEIFFPVPEDVVRHRLQDEPLLDMRVPALDGLVSVYGEGAAWMLDQARRLAALAWRTRPDVIISSPLWASLLASLAHDMLPPATRLISTVDAPPSVSLAHSDSQLLLTRIMREHFNDSDRIIAVSQAIKEDLVHNFGTNEALIQVLHNPVDVPRVVARAEEPVEEGVFDDEVPAIVFVGRLERVKGLEYLLRAMAEVVRVRPARCVLVGDGSQRGYLVALAKHLGIEQHIHFAGAQSNPFKYMRRASAFVLPSLSEGMPVVMIEAMACGAPVIASDIKGGISREVLDNGECGLIFPLRDAKALADAILMMLDDPEAARRFSGRGRERATQFDLPVIMKANEDLILSVGETVGRAEDVAPPPLVDTPTVIEQRDATSSAAPPNRASITRTTQGRVANVVSVLRRQGLPGVSGRVAQRYRYDMAIRGARSCSPHSASYEPPAPGDGAPAKIRVMILVSEIDDADTRQVVSVLPRLLDRDAFEVALTTIYAGGSSRDVLPAEVPRHVLQPSAGCPTDFSTILSEETVSKYRTDLARMDVAAHGLGRLARKLGTDVILAEGVQASLLALMARDCMPKTTSVVPAMRSYARDISGDTALGELHAGLLRTYYGSAERVLALNDDVATDLVEEFGVSADNVVVMRDPIDVELNRHAGEVMLHHPWLEDGLAYVVCMSPSGSEAGVLHLLRALASTRTREAIRCIVFGAAQGRAGVESAALDLGIAEAVSYVAAPGDPTELIRHAAALVEPTPASTDGVSGTVVDAMRMGIPVIATRSSRELEELLQDGACGSLVPMKDPDSLAEAMLQNVWDDDLRDELARRGKERAEEMRAETDIERFEQIIRDAACRSRAL